jgi:hypothetical protein
MEITLTVKHLLIKLKLQFEEFIINFETKAEFIDKAAIPAIAKAGGQEANLTAYREGSEQQVIFSSFNRGNLLNAYGFHMKLRHYIIGSPPSAALMTNLVPTAALYAPLQLIVYENEKGEAIIEYSLPLDYPGEIGQEVAQLGLALDHKLQQLIKICDEKRIY